MFSSRTMGKVCILGWIVLRPVQGWAKSPRTVLDLQEHAKVTTVSLPQGGQAKLFNLNPHIDRWFLLQVRLRTGGTVMNFHLENPYPKDQTLELSNQGDGLVLAGKLSEVKCPVFDPHHKSALFKAAKAKRPYVYICSERLLVRNQMRGQMSKKEVAVNFLRKNIWGGESMISFIKDTLYQDAEIIESDYELKTATESKAVTDGPKPAWIEKQYAGARFPQGKLGIRGDVESDGKLIVGQWYRSLTNPAAYVGVMQPLMVDQRIQRSYKERVLAYDAVERAAMVYLVAFDMTNLSIGYSLGTDHPEVLYSERTAGFLKTPGWKGPDGLEDYRPLVSTGVMTPYEAKRAVATFTGGFKRKHSVFRAGPNATRNGGTHYGFMQAGVVFSSLYEGLATALVTKDGQFELKTWDADDAKRMKDMVFARQNGFPLVYRDAKTRHAVPGPLVRHNFRGNWSGSKQNTIRALRTGMCLQQHDGRKFLIYGFFSSHTPNAMARVFQSFNCDYAMHLDMNLVVHTYLAIYGKDKDKKNLSVEHLVRDMKRNDTAYNGMQLPRFLAVPDNRDFFYLIEKEKDLFSSQSKRP